MNVNTDGYGASIGKAAIGSTVALGALGAGGGRPTAALPTAALGLGGAVAGGAASELLERRGMDPALAGVVGGVGTAAAIMGVATLGGYIFPAIGGPVARAFAALPAAGAVIGAMTAGVWS